MAALRGTLRTAGFRRVGALWIALLFAVAAIFSVAPARAAHAPQESGAHCAESSKPSPTKHPCGDDCCPLCSHSQKESIFPIIDSASGAVAYTPPRATSRAVCAFRAPAVESVRERSRAAPRAPPRLS